MYFQGEFLNEVGNTCPTSKRWDWALLFDISDLGIFEPQFPNRDSLCHELLHRSAGRWKWTDDVWITGLSCTPHDETKSRVFGDPPVFLTVYYLPEWVWISESGYIHDKKLDKTIHTNGSNYMSASGQTPQAAFLMAIQHWEDESRS